MSNKSKWENWPAFYGYWWYKETESSKPALVCVQEPKNGDGLELWECPGIGRTYITGIGSGRYQPVKAADED